MAAVGAAFDVSGSQNGGLGRERWGCLTARRSAAGAKRPSVCIALLGRLCFKLTIPLSKLQESSFCMFRERVHSICAEAQQPSHICRRAVAESNPDHLRRRAQQHTQAVEVLVFRYEHEVLCCRTSPYRPVASAAEAEGQDMRGTRVEVGKLADEARRKVLVEQELHAKMFQLPGTLASLRSRSAAKARQARRSSCESCEKSARISSSLIPLAR